MNNKIGFKTESYKTENYLPVLPETTQKEEEPSIEEQLQRLGMIKAHKALMEYLQGSIYAGVLIEKLNGIRQHFLNV